AWKMSGLAFLVSPQLRPDIAPGVTQKPDAGEVEQVEGADHRAVRLDALPQKPLCGVDADKEMEAGAGRELETTAQHRDEDSKKQNHGDGLIELHWVPQNAVAKVMTPGQVRRGTVGAILDPGEKAAEPP